MLGEAWPPRPRCAYKPFWRLAPLTELRRVLESLLHGYNAVQGGFEELCSILGQGPAGGCPGGLGIFSYSKQYPRNSKSLTTFSCLTNTVMRRREPLPFLLASFLYTLLIL